MKQLTLIVLTCMASLMGSAIDVSPAARLSILTCSPGEEIYSCFGHSALRYHDIVDGQPVDVVYNYGMFDSFEENFELKFMSGDLLYELGKEDYRRFAAMYAYEERSVVEQVMDLSQSDAQKIVDFLEDNYLPENRKYHYHFFNDNCSSRLRDLLLQNFGDRVHIPPRDMGGTTFRNMIDPYLEAFPWTDFGIDLVLGMPTDARLGALDEAFLPDFLMDQMATVSLDGKPLISNQRTLIPERQVPVESSAGPTLVMWIAAIALMALLLALRLFGKRNGWLRATIWTLFGFLGLVMLLMWTATAHDTTQSNLNILFASPLLLVLLFLKRGKFKTALLVIATAAVVIFLLGWAVLPQQFHAATIPLALLVLVANITSDAFPFNPMAGLGR